MAEPLTPKEAVALTVPFAVAVGTCYSFGYWGHFDINALQYVSLLDIAKLAVYPLLFLALTTALAIIYTEVGFGYAFPPGSGANTPVGRLGRKYWRLLVLAITVMTAVSAIAVPDPWRWYVVAVLLTSISPLLTHLQLFIDLVPHPRARSAMAVQIVALPFLALASGKQAAIRAEAGDAALYVDEGRSGLGRHTDQSRPVVYLGRLGESAVFYETMARRLVVVRLKDNAPLVLRRRSAQPGA